MTAAELIPTLAGRFYTDPGIFAAEQEAIFASEWVYVAREDEAPTAGDVVRRHVVGENLILVRGRDEKLRVFYNVCRHRGATVCVSESTHVSRLRCPYHAWSYHLDGRLAGAPNWRSSSEEDRSSLGLREVATAQWGGLVWVRLSDHGQSLIDQLRPQLSYRFGGQPERVERYCLDRLVVGHRQTYLVAANWKLIGENFQECYHCNVIHPELVEQIPAFGSLRTLAAGYQSDGYQFAQARPSFSLSGRAALPPLAGLDEDDHLRYFGMVLRPNCFLSLLPDHVIVHRLEPISPTETLVECDWLFAPEVVGDPAIDLSDTVEIFHRVNQQDFRAAEWCQPNMCSRSYRDGGVLVPLEAETIAQQFHVWYREKMGVEPALGSHIASEEVLA